MGIPDTGISETSIRRWCCIFLLLNTMTSVDRCSLLLDIIRIQVEHVNIIDHTIQHKVCASGVPYYQHPRALEDPVIGLVHCCIFTGNVICIHLCVLCRWSAGRVLIITQHWQGNESCHPTVSDSFSPSRNICDQYIWQMLIMVDIVTMMNKIKVWRFRQWIAGEVQICISVIGDWVRWMTIRIYCRNHHACFG